MKMLRAAIYTLAIAMASSSPGSANSAKGATDFFAQVSAAASNDRTFIVMRHALAPGTGDPSGFALEDCQSQRNLDARGRQQAAEIGALFRANGIEDTVVFSSQWCRCLETASLLKIGAVIPLESLNSFFNRREQGPDQTRAVRQWLASRPPSISPPVLVTHQVNITALTGVYPASGELVFGRVLPSGELAVVARLTTDPTY